MSYMFEILPSLLNGASMTFRFFALVLIFLLPLRVLSIAFALQVHWKPLHHLINLYIWVMRGTPLLLQLIFIFILPSIGIRLDRLPAAIIALFSTMRLTLLKSFRGGIETIPKGQYEAAKVLKFSPFATVHYIILASGDKDCSYRVFLMKL